MACMLHVEYLYNTYSKILLVAINWVVVIILFKKGWIQIHLLKKEQIKKSIYQQISRAVNIKQQNMTLKCKFALY